MRRILGTIGVVAVAAVAGSAGAGLGEDTQVTRATFDPAQAQSASAELEVSGDGAILVAEGRDNTGDGVEDVAYRWLASATDAPEFGFD